MRRFCFLAIAVVAALVPGSAQASAAALIIGLIAAGVFGTILGLATHNRAERDIWIYTEKLGWIGGTREDVSSIDAPLTPTPGTPENTVTACREAIVKNTEDYDVASVEAVSAGKQARVNGNIVAPLDVRVIYRVRGVHEVRRSTVGGEVDRAGQVTATF